MTRTTSHTARLACLLGALALLTAACGGLGWGSDTPTVDGEPIDGDWELVAGEVDGGRLEAPDDHPITLRIDGDEIGGRSACNSYFGDIETDGADVTVGGIGMTETACHPPEIMDLEATYLEALQRVDHVDHVERGGELVLTGPDVELRYRSVTPTSNGDG